MKYDTLIRNAHLTTQDYNAIVDHVVYLLNKKGLKATPGNIAEFLNKIYITSNFSRLNGKEIMRTQDGFYAAYIK